MSTRVSTRVRTRVWRHPPSGRTVTLVEMAHVARPRFYAAVQALVDRLEDGGAEVHYEGVEAPPPDAHMSDVERALLDRLLTAHHRLYSGMARITGHVQQLDHLTVRPHWRNTDITELDLLRALPDPEQYVAEAERSADRVDDLQRDPILRFWIWAALRIPRFVLGPARDWQGDVDGDKAATVAARNTAAVRAVLATDRDVVALWGTAHHAGIGHGLREAGFQAVAP